VLRRVYGIMFSPHALLVVSLYLHVLRPNLAFSVHDLNIMPEGTNMMNFFKLKV
jgi:hypothetical protein